MWSEGSQGACCKMHKQLLERLGFLLDELEVTDRGAYETIESTIRNLIKVAEAKTRK